MRRIIALLLFIGGITLIASCEHGDIEPVEFQEDPPQAVLEALPDSVMSRATFHTRVFLGNPYFLDGCMEVSSFENTWEGEFSDADIVLLSSVDLRGLSTDFLSGVEGLYIAIWDGYASENFAVYTVRTAQMGIFFRLDIRSMIVAKGTFAFNNRYVALFLIP